MGTSEHDVRPVRRDDLPALVELMAAAEEVDRTEEFLDLDDLVEMFENPLLDPARDWVVVADGATLVASAVLWPRAPDGSILAVYVDGVVHPQWRGRGLGSLLVPRMVDRARAYVAERDPALTPVIRATSGSDNAGAHALLTACGFEGERWNFLMQAELSARSSSSPDAPEGFTVATWEGADHDELRAAHNLAFGGYHHGFSPWTGPMWEHLVRDSRALRPASSLVLRDAHGAVAAYVQTNEYDAVQAATGVREAFVAKVGTVPAHRRHGLATLLLDRALELYQAQGFARAALDVDSENPSGALGVYERAGFTTIKRFTHYRLP